MSVRSDFYPTAPSLSGNEGDLVSVHICVEPRLLERLLEALSGLSFPVNPQIYHQASVAYVFADGTEKREPAVIVEVPAFSDRLTEIREALIAHGLPEDAAHVRNMLDDIHADHCAEKAPAGAPYKTIRFYKTAACAAVS